MAITRRQFVLGGSSLFLAACASTPPPRPEIPRVTFTHRPRLGFAVTSIDIAQEFVASGQAPNVEHIVPIPPAQVARQWAVDRLVAAGPEGNLRYVIVDAAITETELKTDKTVSGALKTQVDRRFDGRIEIRMDLQNSTGQGTATTVVTRSQTALENLSLNERDELLVQFVEDMGRDLDQRLEAEINTNLTRFLLPV